MRDARRLAKHAAAVQNRSNRDRASGGEGGQPDHAVRDHRPRPAARTAAKRRRARRRLGLALVVIAAVAAVAGLALGHSAGGGSPSAPASGPPGRAALLRSVSPVSRRVSTRRWPGTSSPGASSASPTRRCSRTRANPERPERGWCQTSQRRCPASPTAASATAAGSTPSTSSRTSSSRRPLTQWSRRRTSSGASSA